MTDIYLDNAPPIKNAVWAFYISLISQADTNIFQVNPTLATGDVKTSIDGGALNNITALPVVVAAGKLIKVSLTAAEMNGNKICVIFSDQAGEEWQDAVVMISTEKALTIAAFPTGAIEYTYTVTDSISGLPLGAVEVWISTDILGTNIIWAGQSDITGVAKNILNAKPWLDAATYYFWRQKTGYTFTNPDTEVVS